MTFDRRVPRGKFIFKKVSKIRWRPPITQSGHIFGSLFVTGTWDDSSNAVELWCFDDAAGSDPVALAKYDHNHGDVNEIQFLGGEYVATACSSGSLTLLKISREMAMDSNDWTIQPVKAWDRIHSINGKAFSCNGVNALGGEQLLTAGEDGQVFILNANQDKPLRTFEKADSCSLTTILTLKSDEFITGNVRGQLKVWDVRAKDQEPSFVCVLSTEQVGITCVAKHPVQNHVLCTGSEDGKLAFWDLRKERHPVTILNAHQGAVSEVKFHAQQPEHLFSCCQSGDIFHWNGSGINPKPSASLMGGNFYNSSSKPMTNPWLNSEGVKNRVDVKSVMAKQNLPLNSLDSCGSSLLFGGDNEAFYVVPEVLL